MKHITTFLKKAAVWNRVKQALVPGYIAEGKYRYFPIENSIFLDKVIFDKLDI